VLINIIGGEAGIRTLGGDKPSTVFKTAAFDRSATSPVNWALYNTLLKNNEKFGLFSARHHFN
jgi:hypothetical protein